MILFFYKLSLTRKRLILARRTSFGEVEGDTRGKFTFLLLSSSWRMWCGTSRTLSVSEGERERERERKSGGERKREKERERERDSGVVSLLSLTHGHRVFPCHLRGVGVLLRLLWLLYVLHSLWPECGIGHGWWVCRPILQPMYAREMERRGIEEERRERIVCVRVRVWCLFYRLKVWRCSWPSHG